VLLLKLDSTSLAENPSRQHTMDQECCAACEADSEGLASSKSTANVSPQENVNSLRILTWTRAAPSLQTYADYYHENYPQEPSIQVKVVPSLQDLQKEIVFEFAQPHNSEQPTPRLYDGFVVPPLLLGDMYQKQNGAGLAVWNKEDIDSFLWDKLLPYYRYQVAEYDGAIRSLPILGGSQMLLLFRKDYLDAMNMPTPKTWSDFVRIAAVMHNEPLLEIENGNSTSLQPIYGSCFGRMSLAACRKRDDLAVDQSALCQSESMTYLGMMLASMTQVQGHNTGWMLGLDEDIPSGLSPLFEPTIETILVLMEQQLKYGAPNELTEDAGMNLRLFDEGRCAMTVTANHKPDLLSQDNIGFVPLPGNHQYLDREINEMVDCTETSCPYGREFDEWGQVNFAPFGSVYATVGAVSGFTSPTRQAHAKRFFHFVFSNQTQVNTTGLWSQQPLTDLDLQESTIPGYNVVMSEVTGSENAATPFRVPNAFSTLSDLDNRVYSYLVEGDFSESRRQQVATFATRAWQNMIRMYDARGLGMPTSMMYQKSIGSFEPEPSSDLYIGWVARGIGWGLGGLSCLVSLYLAFWVMRYRNERVIRASQPIFLLMICFGTLVMASSIFPFGMEDDIASYQACTVSCMAGLWLFCIGFAITFSALFSKIYLVRSMLRQTQGQQRITMKKSDILLPNSFLYFINVVVMLIWTLVDPQKWVRIPVNEEASSLNLAEASARGWCDSDQTKMYLGIILGTNLVMMVISLIQAYECRKITTEYNESLYVSAAVAVIAQIWVVGLPILRLLEVKPRGVFVTKVAIIFLSSVSTLILIFGPKMSYFHIGIEQKKHQIYIKSGKKSTESNEHQAELEASDTQSHTEHSDEVVKDENGQKRNRKARRKLEPLGIRVIPASFIHSEEADRLHMAVDKAEQRNRFLQASLESLQEKMEQYIIARGPLGGFHNNADGNDSDRLITRSKKILASRPEVLLSKSIHGAASSTSLY
jgi:ABC-type glycerol-3-phosphate transport system substrate-binding protein